jgi:diaminohydroxyphosphoribosylaminopyrimidine deaminase/5-amino-6-(5-phosphoribosylamino)uracil reductase
MVGAIVVKEDRAIGKGYHARAGEAHAERVALEKAGGTEFILLNLEPCTRECYLPVYFVRSGVSSVVRMNPNPREGKRDKGVGEGETSAPEI